MAKFLGFTFLFVFLALAATGGIVAYFVLEGAPPEIRVISPPEVIGREYTLEVDARDERSGLKSLSVSIAQDEKSIDLEPRLFEVKNWWKGSGVKQQTVSWQISPLKLGLSEGKAIISVSARDSSWRNGLKGNEGIWRAEIPVDVTPPVIEVKSTVHNLRVGGSGLVTYKVSEAVSGTGVWVDECFFPGSARTAGGGEGIFVAMLAVPVSINNPGKVLIEAVDLAGNSAGTGLPHRILRMTPKVENIEISDSFLAQKMPDFMARYPDLQGSPMDVFLWVNGELRRRNNQEIKERCSDGVNEILWHGSFVALPRSAFKAGFADYRHYFYKGKEIDQAYHMGIDQASLSHSEVPAGNTGIVVFAEYLGIYGNTVILDHGLGLYSLYAHLSEIRVKSGEKVERGDVIGITGATGLAGGDHLHYATIVHGVFVNPIEWWDKKWIDDHILNNFAAQ
jgi:murein DD-endopeptidase MepM/ murein hydrolase activator NlpD